MNSNLRLSVFFGLLTACVWVYGCSRAQAAQEDNHDHDDHAGHSHAKKSHAGHVHADGTAATQAEWCSFNNVPQEKCQSVLAEYKAKGDWCEQHNLPQTRCTKCNPSLKLQPVKSN
jgi:hypothetical protein